MAEHDHQAPSRRGFLRSAGVLAAAGLAGCKSEQDAAPSAPATPPTETSKADVPPAPETQAGDVQRRKLGKTGLEVCVVGMGATGAVANVIRAGVTKGINYIDTSECYMGGRSEEVVGQGIEGIRDQAVIATKWDAKAHENKQQILDRLDGSLKRLGTDHVDIILIHQLGDHGDTDDGTARIKNPALYEAIAEAKQSGKARFAGASSHVGQRKKILGYALDSDQIDMILVAYNYGNFDRDGMAELLAKAKAKNVGVVGMKATQGNRQPPQLAGRQEDLFQAQLRWVLAKGCHTVVNSKLGNSIQHQDTALKMAGQEIVISQADQTLLNEYQVATAGLHCNGCDHICQGACPAGVRIADVLRYRMYHDHYGEREQAVAYYNELSEPQQIASLCGECNLCTQVCPHGVQVVEQLFDARQRLLA